GCAVPHLLASALTALLPRSSVDARSLSARGADLLASALAPLLPRSSVDARSLSARGVSSARLRAHCAPPSFLGRCSVAVGSRCSGADLAGSGGATAGRHRCSP